MRFRHQFVLAISVAPLVVVLGLIRLPHANSQSRSPMPRLSTDDTDVVFTVRINAEGRVVFINAEQQTIANGGLAEIGELARKVPQGAEIVIEAEGRVPFSMVQEVLRALAKRGATTVRSLSIKRVDSGISPTADDKPRNDTLLEPSVFAPWLPLSSSKVMARTSDSDPANIESADPLPIQDLAGPAKPAESQPTLPAPGMPEALESASAAGTKTRIFILTNANATEVARILAELLPGDMAMSFDQRINLVLVRAPKDKLTEIEAIVQVLDQEGISPEKPGTIDPISTIDGEGLSSARSLDLREVSRLRAKYHEAERKAAACAREYRELPQSKQPSRNQSKDGLRVAIAQAFVARQELQRAEVGQLRERLHTVEAKIRRREQLKDKIIEKRVQQLLEDEDLRWETPSLEFSDSSLNPSVVPTLSKLIDVPTEDLQLKVHRVRSDLTTVLQVLQTMLAGQEGTSLASEPRTGGIIALARPAEHQTIQEIIAQLGPDAAIRKGGDVTPSDVARNSRIQLSDESRGPSVSSHIKSPQALRQAIIEAKDAVPEANVSLLRAKLSFE